MTLFFYFLDNIEKKFKKNLSHALNTFKIIWKMEHLFQKSKCSIFHNIFEYMMFQNALLWSKGLNIWLIEFCSNQIDSSGLKFIKAAGRLY